MAEARHRDFAAADIEWQTGMSADVKYAMFRMDEARPSSPTIVLSTFEPGATVPPHTHDSNYFEYIISGEQTVGKTVFRTGDVRIVKGGTGYGPITVGPEGCTVLIAFEDGTRAQTVLLPRKTAAA